jgi:hypothetical protein
MALRSSSWVLLAIVVEDPFFGVLVTGFSTSTHHFDQIIIARRHVSKKSSWSSYLFGSNTRYISERDGDENRLDDCSGNKLC